jgi:hypothetical protein
MRLLEVLELGGTILGWDKISTSSEVAMKFNSI